MIPKSAVEGPDLNCIRPSRFLAIAVVVCASTASAQLTSDVVPRQRLVPRREQIRRDLQDSRYRIGPFRLQPELIFRDLGYNNNVFGTPEDPISDWTATVAAGTHWTLPFGPKTYFRGDLLPEYSWYAKETDRRFVGGTYNASAVALFNRLSLEATAGTAKGLATVNSEIEAPVIRRLTDVSFEGELELLRRLSVFGAVQGQRFRHRSRGLEATELARIGELDRDESAVRGGIRYRFRSFFDISVGAERTESEFDAKPLERDNQSEAVILGIHYDRDRFYANVNVADREGKPLNGSGMTPYQTNTGSYFLSYSLVAPLELQAYGHRRLAYGLHIDNPYFIETRTGGAVGIHLGHRVLLRTFGETGDNAYPVATRVGRNNPAVKRNDNALTYGGALAFRLFRNSALTVVVSKTDYDSNTDEFDRSVVRIQSGLSLRGGSAR